MSTLRESLVTVRSAVELVLLFSKQAGKLYTTVYIAGAVNIKADVEENTTITTKVDANIFRCAFAHPYDKFVLQYKSFFVVNATTL
jgi:hypothetical protein